MRISGMLAGTAALAAFVWFFRHHDSVLIATVLLAAGAAAVYLLRGGGGALVADRPGRRGPVVVLIVALLVVVGFAGATVALRGPTPAAVRTALASQPGVERAAAGKVGGDGLGFQSPPVDAHVFMTTGATAADIRTAVGAVRDDLEIGDVRSLTVIARTPLTVRARVTTTFSPEQADQLVAARDDKRVRNWIDDGDTVVVRLVPGLRLKEVVGFWKVQRAVPGGAGLTVTSGRFSLVRGEDDDASVTEARLAFARELDRKVPLIGASISGTGSLALFVSAADKERAQKWVKAHRASDVGTVRVNPLGPGPW